MRLRLSEFIKPTDYFLHADMWNLDRFPIQGKVINTGLGESNLLNIAGGLASQGNTVYVYGVAGFVIHRFEQLKFSCKRFGANTGKIIICNAGKYGYDELGGGHSIEDDRGLMNLIDTPVYDLTNVPDFIKTLEEIENHKYGLWYIRLGRDVKWIKNLN